MCIAISHNQNQRHPPHHHHDHHHHHRQLNPGAHAPLLLLVWCSAHYIPVRMLMGQSTRWHSKKKTKEKGCKGMQNSSVSGSEQTRGLAWCCKECCRIQLRICTRIALSSPWCLRNRRKHTTISSAAFVLRPHNLSILLTRNFPFSSPDSTQIFLSTAASCCCCCCDSFCIRIRFCFFVLLTYCCKWEERVSEWMTALELVCNCLEVDKLSEETIPHGNLPP